ncbi:ankyrin repeat and KH domain-containing protein 1-like [Haliotis rufescens]|uniref:ankyrin repeat and KH domain-containing protein 1-like n=1 Tax=Haliotis rufescens TaxID=6454 RepID=UPI00201EBE53|nr:ankyrin repeat and KH domain-containing protein 1-like [Haliotis rufescens]
MEKFYPSRSQQQKRDQKRKSGDNILHEACREGDLSRVQHILTEGHVDLNSREMKHGRTPLMLAATEGHRDVFDLVMSKGGNVSLVDINGDNILHLACLGGHVEIVKYILSQNIADINSRGQYGRTSAMVAATEGQRDVFDLIMSKGGNVSLVDTHGDNILHLACLRGHVEMVKYILSQNIADINSRGQYGRTSAMVAATEGHRDVFDLVMSKGGNVSLVDTHGDNILHLACLRGHVEMVKYILSQKIVDINCRGMYGRTPLMFAATEGHRDVFDLVMSKGGNVSLVDTHGDNTLHLACLRGHAEMVKYILSQKIVDINGRGMYGRTPLMFAAIEGHKDVFDLVMSKGGDVSAFDGNGNNILHLACLGGNVEIVKYILSQNIAEINSRDTYGRTPLMMAAAEEHKDVFDLLVSKGCDVSAFDGNGNNILHLACFEGHVEMVKYILSQNILDINSRGVHGRTSLMFAATEGHKDVFDSVMSKGGDASLVDTHGDNILLLACLGGHAEMVKYILSQNIVDINSRGLYGRTPLMVAVAGGYKDVFDLLVSEGGDVSAVDGNGSTILHVACFCGQVEMVKHILSQGIVDIHAKDKYGHTAAMMAKRRKHMKVYDLIISKG